MISIPARFRKIIYLVSAAVALVLGLFQAFFAGSHLTQPPWLLGVVAMLAFLQTFVSGLAASRTPSDDPPTPAQVPSQVPSQASRSAGAGH